MDESEAIEGSYGGGPDVLEEKLRDPQTYFPRDVDEGCTGIRGEAQRTTHDTRGPPWKSLIFFLNFYLTLGLHGLRT